MISDSIPQTKGYKVIVIRGYWSETKLDEENGCPLSAFVYSLRTDSWSYLRVLKRFYYLERSKCNIRFNGAFHWLGSYEPDGNSQVIVSFDMTTDEFEERKLPDYDKPTSNSLCSAT